MERLFGVWERRFPILSRGIRVSRYTMYKIDYYIVTCSILHAFIMKGVPPIDLRLSITTDHGGIGNPALVPNVNRNGNTRNAVRYALVDDWFAAQL